MKNEVRMFEGRNEAGEVKGKRERRKLFKLHRSLETSDDEVNFPSSSSTLSCSRRRYT